MNGVTDISNGSCCLFYIDNLENLNSIPPRLKASAQFRRLGPAVVALFGAAGALAEPSLVEFYTVSDFLVDVLKTSLDKCQKSSKNS